MRAHGVVHAARQAETPKSQRASLPESDNRETPPDEGAEFTSKPIRDWLQRIGAKTLYIGPGRPCENGYCESFNGKLRDELLNGEIVYSLKEATVVIEQWRLHYNQRRPRSSLRYRPPAPQAIYPKTLELQTSSMIH